MTPLPKLIWRDLLANRGRVAVSVFAILVSVSLIVWMMGSYDTLVKEFDNDAEAYMGSYDLCLVPEAPRGPLPPGGSPGLPIRNWPRACRPLRWWSPSMPPARFRACRSVVRMNAAVLTSRRATAWAFRPKVPSWWGTWPQNVLTTWRKASGPT